MSKPRVFIPNLSHHDFTSARKFGELVFLTEGWVPPQQVNNIFRQCYEKMKDCTDSDFLLISSLPIINAAASSIMAMKCGGRLQFLIFDHGNYIPVRISVEPGGFTNEADSQAP